MTETGSMAAKRAAVIINPSKSTDVDIRELITRHSKDNGWGEPVWIETTVEDPGQGQAKEALKQGVDVVIAAGGDGTVRAVAEGLAGSDTPLGLVPMGTGNLLARNLGMDVTDFEAAVAGALTGTERKIDVVRAVQNGKSGEESTKVFLVMAGLGYDATIMADTDEELKDKVGWLAYVDAGIRNLPGKPVRATISVDGRQVAHRRVRSIMVGNCGKVQGGVEIFPDAKVDDGLLDVVVLAPQGRFGWFSVLAGMIVKGRGKDTSVEYYQGTKVEVRLEHGEDYQLDGEYEGNSKHVTMTLEPAAVAIRMTSPDAAS